MPHGVPEVFAYRPSESSTRMNPHGTFGRVFFCRVRVKNASHLQKTLSESTKGLGRKPCPLVTSTLCNFRPTKCGGTSCIGFLEKPCPLVASALCNFRRWTILKVISGWLSVVETTTCSVIGRFDIAVKMLRIYRKLSAKELQGASTSLSNPAQF